MTLVNKIFTSNRIKNNQKLPNSSHKHPAKMRPQKNIPINPKIAPFPSLKIILSRKKNIRKSLITLLQNFKSEY